MNFRLQLKVKIIWLGPGKLFGITANFSIVTNFCSSVIKARKWKKKRLLRKLVIKKEITKSTAALVKA